MLQVWRNNIVHYWKVYRVFVQTCVGVASSFRLHFFLVILMDLFFYFSSLASVDFIFTHVALIGPWNREQLLFFLSVMLAIDQWHMTIISESFWVLSYLIRSGTLDFILLKPVGSLFIVCFRNFRPSSLLNILVTVPMVIHFGLKIGLGLMDFVLLPFLMVLGFVLLVQMEVIITCSMFWMLEGVGINFLRMELQKVSRWPDFIYGRLARKVFLTAIPILLVGNAPVRFILNHGDYTPLLGLVFANIVLGFLLRWLWARALRTYESASS